MQAETAKVALGDIRLKGKILDIGCGSGAITAYMASRTEGTVLGIDNAQSMISFAQENYKDIQNISFKLADATAWPFSQTEFDYIVSFSCLHWIRELQPVIKNIAISLKQNGRFIACLSPFNHFLYQPLLEVAQSPRWFQFFKDPSQQPWHPQDIKSFSSLLIQADLKPLSVYGWDKRTTSKSREDFIAFLNGWIRAVPHVIQLPHQLKDEFIENVTDFFLKSVTFLPDKSFEYITPYLMAIAEK